MDRCAADATAPLRGLRGAAKREAVFTSQSPAHIFNVDQDFFIRVALGIARPECWTFSHEATGLVLLNDDLKVVFLFHEQCLGSRVGHANVTLFAGRPAILGRGSLGPFD